MKKKKHKEIFKLVAGAGETAKGYEHRRHRSKKQATGKKKYINPIKIQEQKRLEKEFWEEAKKQVNIMEWE